MNSQWSCHMPSNIALIKYMGKEEGEGNLPLNPSLSWTLEHLKSHVTITMKTSGEDQWEPLPTDHPLVMDQKGVDKFLKHFQRIKKVYGLNQSFLIASGNNFPADCGIASSASSFAALTQGASMAFEELGHKKLSLLEKAQLSALGSGSSCRSFLPGLVEWEGGAKLKTLETRLKGLHHMVVIVGEGRKQVSSSKAHQRVKSSLLFEGRVGRSKARLAQFKKQLKPLDWAGLYETLWAEFWDMHALFETSQPSFGYFLKGSLQVLQEFRAFWETKGDGPLITMDAGPNIHLLWREDQVSLALECFEKFLKNRWTCLSDLPEVGFAQL